MPYRESGLPEALRLLRKRRGLSQAQLAGLAESAQARITLYETGKAEPMIGTVDQLLRAMGWSLADLEAARREVLAGVAEDSGESGSPGRGIGDWSDRFTDELAARAEEELRKRAPDVLRDALHDLLDRR